MIVLLVKILSRTYNMFNKSNIRVIFQRYFSNFFNKGSGNYNLHRWTITYNEAILSRKIDYANMDNSF